VLLGYPKQDEALQISSAAALKALELNPNLSLPHLILGWNTMFSWDWAGAAEHFQRAVILDHSAETTRSYTAYLAGIGRFQEAIELADRSAKADPLSADNQFSAGLAHFQARLWAEAIPHYQRALELNPQDRMSRNQLAECFARTGRPKEAMALLDRPEDRTELGIVYAMTGRRTEALQIARSISKPGLNPDPMSLACIYFLIGDKDSGFVWLTKAVDAHHPAVYGLKIFPMFDDVRPDPRFQALVTRMKVP
jgi:tetratricopeptide (TPR) repeat protein